MKKLNKGGFKEGKNRSSTIQLERFVTPQEKNEYKQLQMTTFNNQSKIKSKLKSRPINKNGKRINDNYLEYLNNYIEFYESRKKPVKNYNSVIKYIKDYKYYKKNLDYNKDINIISLFFNLQVVSFRLSSGLKIFELNICLQTNSSI
jgi:hypothetical protein